MKYLMLALLVAMPAFGSGCSFAQNIRRNIVYSPIYTYTDRAEDHRNHALAREAFRQMALQYTDHEFSCDYRIGFVDGFADYLDYGGVGEPQPLPASRYRTFGYMTPDGLAAMEDWKLGWRHGAATARASNLRELCTLPVFWGPSYDTVPVNPPRAPKIPKEEGEFPFVGPPPPPLADPIPGDLPPPPP